MSDDDDFMQDSDQEQYVKQGNDALTRHHLTTTRYDFEYEDGDEEETGDVGIENKYYNAKQMKADNPDEAIDEFLGLPALEDEKGDWYVHQANYSSEPHSQS